MPQVIPAKVAHPGKSGTDKIVATEEDLEQIHLLASAGKSLKIIALRLGISRSLFDTWMGNSKARKGDPRVREAWEAGAAEHEEMLTGVLHKAIANDGHRMQVASAMFMLKVKHGWRETQAIEVEAKQAAPNRYVTKDITPDDQKGDL